MNIRTLLMENKYSVVNFTSPDDLEEKNEEFEKVKQYFSERNPEIRFLVLDD